MIPLETVRHHEPVTRSRLFNGLIVGVYFSVSGTHMSETLLQLNLFFSAVIKSYTCFKRISSALINSIADLISDITINYMVLISLAYRHEPPP